MVILVFFKCDGCKDESECYVYRPDVLPMMKEILEREGWDFDQPNGRCLCQTCATQPRELTGETNETGGAL